MDEILKKFGTSNVFQQCCVGLTTSAGNQKIDSFGGADQYTLFDCASLTKVWPTNELIQMAIDEKKISETDLLSKYLHQTHNASVGAQTIGDLRRFLVGWDIFLSQQKDLDAKVLMDKLLATKTQTVSEPQYSNASSIFLGMILEHVYKKRLEIIANEKLFAPLGLKRTGFFPKEIDAENIVPTEIDSWRQKELRGEVHDESAWILQQGGLIPGSAGLFSCVHDLLILAQWQLQHSTSQGVGWEDRTALWIGEMASSNAYGKTGFTGCSVLIDPEKQKAVVILSNATYPHRPLSREPLQDFRRAVHQKFLA